MGNAACADGPDLAQRRGDTEEETRMSLLTRRFVPRQPQQNHRTTEGTELTEKSNAEEGAGPAFRARRLVGAFLRHNSMRRSTHR